MATEDGSNGEVRSGERKNVGKGSGIRILGLYLFASASTIVSTGPVVALGFLVEAVRTRSRSVLLWFVVGMAIVYVWSGSGDTPLWYFSRGWAVVFAGAFTALESRYRFRDGLNRTIAAAALAAVAVAVILAARPGAWATLDQLILSYTTEGMDRFLLAMGDRVDGEWSQAFREIVSAYVLVFPALLGLASMAAMTVGRWAYGVLVNAEGFGPVVWRDVRFSDHLVWALIAGVAMVVFSGFSGESTGVAGDVAADAAVGVTAGVGRIGLNVVVFMAALYALRGWGVMLWLWSGTFWMVLMTVVLLVFSPFAVGLAVAVGLGDTWLDIRTKARELMPRDES